MVLMEESSGSNSNDDNKIHEVLPVTWEELSTDWVSVGLMVWNDETISNSSSMYASHLIQLQSQNEWHRWENSGVATLVIRTSQFERRSQQENRQFLRWHKQPASLLLIVDAFNVFQREYCHFTKKSLLVWNLVPSLPIVSLVSLYV